MVLWVLVSMLFGYLTSFAQKGEDFAVIMPLVLLALAAPALWSRQTARAVAVLAMAAFGFAILVFGTHYGLRFTEHLGPAIAGTPIVMAAVWIAVMLAALTIARSMAIRYRRGIVVVTGVTVFAAMLAAFTITPAFFALGLTEYAGRGLYFGVPLGEHVLWFVSALLSGIAGYFLFGEETALGQRTLDSGILLVALATGVNVAHHLWLPAVLGLLLMQYGFSLRHHL